MNNNWIKWFLASFLMVFTAMTWAAPALKPDAPATYVVQPGDTVWSVASRYLEKPWQWDELYRANPDLGQNPDRLYPGDILFLNGDRLHAKVTRKGRKVLKLSPQMRMETLEHPIPVILYADIKPFLRGILILDDQELQHKPYVLAIEEQSKTAVNGQQIYAKGLDEPHYQEYYIYRKDQKIINPKDKSVIGYEAKYIGAARVLRYKPGSPAVLNVIESLEEIQPGDRLMAAPPLANTQDMLLREPKHRVEGQILTLIGDSSQMVQHQIAIITLGKSQDMRIGDVLAVYRLGAKVPDPLDKHAQIHKSKWIQLPNERMGEVVLFKIFNQASLGLIVNSKQEIKKMDQVTNP